MMSGVAGRDAMAFGEPAAAHQPRSEHCMSARRGRTMSTQEPSGGGHQGHQTDAEAHPERAVDDFEERVLGRRMDQARTEDETETAFGQAREEKPPGTEQP